MPESRPRLSFRLQTGARLLGVTALAAACLILGGNGTVFHASSPADSPQYVDSRTCQGCHREIYDSYQEVAMGRSFYPPSPENVIEDYTVNNHFHHALSNRHYRMIQRDGRFYQRRYQLDSKGREINVFEQEVTHIIGSGNHARTYLNLDTHGVLRQLPVSWYSQEQRWAMSPSYDRPDHYDFSRQVSHACMFCHNAYPPLPEPSDRFGLQSLFPPELPSGIDCQRCHGPGARHLELASSGRAEAEEVRQSIVNPVRLGPEREMDVCMQCHLPVATAGPHIQRFDRSIYSFRPGEPLTDYVVHFDLVDPVSHEVSERFEVDSSAYRLLRSACFVQSRGKMTCTTCHDPHHAPRGEQAVRYFRERCLSCHPQVSEPVHPQPGESDCVSCHMPQRRTQDAVHVVMTDHLIQRRPPQKDLLAPLQEDHSPHTDAVVLNNPDELPLSQRDLYWGLGQIQTSADLSQGLDRLGTVLPKWGGSSPEPYLQLALIQVDSGDLRQAGINLRRALEADPDLALTRLKLGEVLEQQGKLEEAAEQFRHTLRLDPNHAGASNALGQILKARGQTKAAMEHFRQALRSDPLSADAHAGLGAVFLQQGKAEQAIREFHSALRITPDNPEDYRSLGLAQVELGRHGEAIEAFRQAIGLKPDDAEAHFSLGVAYGQTGRLREAVEVLRQAVQIDPDQEEAHSNLALIYGRLGQWPEASAAWLEVIRINPGEVETFLKLGLSYGQAGRFQEAITTFKQAIRLKPDHAEAYSNLGVAYGQLGRHQEASEAFEETIRLKPDSLQAHLNLGTAYVQLGRLPEAIDAFQTATRIKPGLVELHQFIGEAHARLGKPREAIPAFQAVLRFRPQDAEAHLSLAMAYLAIGEKALALAQHRRLKDLDAQKARQLMDRINRQGNR